MTSTVYRDPHGTSTVKFGTAVYRGYREYRPSLVCGLAESVCFDVIKLFTYFVQSSEFQLSKHAFRSRQKD